MSSSISRVLLLAGAVLASASNFTTEKEEEDRIRAEVKSSINVSTTPQPNGNVGYYEDPICLMHWAIGYPNLKVWWHQTLLSGSANTIIVKTDSQPEIINNAKEDQLFKIKKKITEVQSTTVGWTAGANLQYSGLSIQGGYSNERTQSHTTEEELDWERHCPGFHRCKVETWTIHVKIEGRCKSHRNIDLAIYGPSDICTTEFTPFCNQVRNIIDRDTGCFEDTSCQLFMPVYKGDKPYSLLYISAIPFSQEYSIDGGTMVELVDYPGATD